MAAMTAPEDKHQGLRATRKAVKKAASNVREISSAKPKPPAKKAPAKKAPAKKAEPRKAVPKVEVLKDAEHPWYTHPGYVAKPGHQLYEATGLSGQTSVRSSAKPLTHAISWGDPDRAGERAKYLRIGVIHDWFESEEAAQKVAAKRREDYPNNSLVVVAAQPYKGQPGDKK